jgi:hypothetical protein
MRMPGFNAEVVFASPLSRQASARVTVVAPSKPVGRTRSRTRSVFVRSPGVFAVRYLFPLSIPRSRF